jgi:ribonuclease P protein component
VFKRAQRSADQDFTILSRSNDLGWARLGLAVSRKVSPRAVVRNRIKRMVRESFRQHQDQLGQLDLVVIGKPAAAARSRTELTRSLERHWSRIAKHRRAPVHD